LFNTAAPALNRENAANINDINEGQRASGCPQGSTSVDRSEVMHKELT